MATAWHCEIYILTAFQSVLQNLTSSGLAVPETSVRDAVVVLLNVEQAAESRLRSKVQLGMALTRE